MKSSKFVGPVAAVPGLSSLPKLELMAQQQVSTVYFDDEEDRCYADQFRKSARRFKVRLRRVDAGSTLEVKLKGGRGEPLRSRAATEIDADAVAFIRECLDSAFEPGFARGIEQRLRPVVETEFVRELWGYRGDHALSVDTDVVLRVDDQAARLLPGLALIELARFADEAGVPQWLHEHGFKAVGFSKFGAAQDLLRSERVRSHKPGLLPSLFALD